MDLKLLQRLIRIMKRGELTELEIDEKETGVHLRLRRGSEAPAPQVHVLQGGAVGVHPASAAGPHLGAGSGSPAIPAAPATAGHTITSPMVGTFYRSSSPDAEPFVQAGTRIKAESPLCIIEAMKVMNEIKSEVAGEVLEVLVENGEPVEFGQPLFLVQVD
ncbi:MAG: acetyl-CoA carboxylase biotin carboxyl carrier protein [Planctomycetota bacterium]